MEKEDKGRWGKRKIDWRERSEIRRNQQTKVKRKDEK